MEKKQSKVSNIKERKIIPLKCSNIFSTIFNDQNYDFVLKKLLFDTLNEKNFNDDIHYLNQELKEKKINNKLDYASIMVKQRTKNSKDEYINYEIFVAPTAGDVFDNRIKSINNLQNSDHYDDIVKEVKIYFDFFDYPTSKFITVGKMINMDSSQTLGSSDEVYHICNKFVSNDWYHHDNEQECKIAKWCRLMTADTEETFLECAKEVMSEEEALKLVERVIELTNDKKNTKLLCTYSKEEMALNIEEERTKIGKENALKALALSLDDDTISKITGLSLDEIAKLKVQRK